MNEDGVETENWGGEEGGWKYGNWGGKEPWQNEVLNITYHFNRLS